MTAPEARHGEVWFADVPGDKRRPVLVLSRDPMGRILHSVICAPITSRIRGLTTEVALGRDVGLAEVRRELRQHLPAVAPAFDPAARTGQAGHAPGGVCRVGHSHLREKCTSQKGTRTRGAKLAG